jgi:sugar O-acyltransferase (sialic acid O-acetyltransferase NeuD family)
MTFDLAIFGAGGHGRVVADALLQGLSSRRLVFVDDSPTREPPASMLSVLGRDELPFGTSCIIAVGDNSTRRQIRESLGAHARFVSAVHPRATVADSAQIGAGAVVLAGAVVGPYARVGEHCIINHNAVLDHDSVMGPFSSLGPGALVGGGCQIGAGAVIAIGAVVLHGLEVGDGTIVGANSTLTRSAGAESIYIGTPARRSRYRDSEEGYL